MLRVILRVILKSFHYTNTVPSVKRDYGYGFSNGLHQFFVTIEDVDDNFLYDRRDYYNP